MGDLFAGCFGVIAYGIAAILVTIGLLLGVAVLGVLLAFAAPILIVCGLLFVLLFVFMF